jgi:LPXTG-site transpeptidase (sortase) family protein
VPRVTLSPRQWAGVFDGRLIEPVLSSRRPARLTIDAIALDAPVVQREIVAGRPQDPVGSENVAWYQETAAVGEGSNMVMAGHLNDWGSPEGVFYHLDSLHVGDRITVTAEDGTTATYEVTAVTLVDRNTSDVAKIIGPSKRSLLTLITCGGDWDPAHQTYTGRTIVRAELVDS